MMCEKKKMCRRQLGGLLPISQSLVVIQWIVLLQARAQARDTVEQRAATWPAGAATRPVTGHDKVGLRASTWPGHGVCRDTNFLLWQKGSDTTLSARGMDLCIAIQFCVTTGGLRHGTQHSV